LRTSLAMALGIERTRTQRPASHGSIKEMERLFGVSYPTMKNRLNRLSQAIGSALGVETEPAPTAREVLDRLERGEITADQAAEELKR